MSATDRLTGSKLGRLTRLAAWLALTATAQTVLQPLLAQQGESPGAEYIEWVLERGLDATDRTLQLSLETAATRGHDSIESFVLDFVHILAEREGLEAARGVVPEGVEVGSLSQADLASLILSDLRALAPKEPVATARLTSSERAALVTAERLVPVRDQRSVLAKEQAVGVPTPSVLVPPARGLSTSIQALGP